MKKSELRALFGPKFDANSSQAYAAGLAIDKGLLDLEDDFNPWDLRAELRAARKKLGVTQNQLSLMLGKKQQQVCLWESSNGPEVPLWVIANLRAIAAGLVTIPAPYRRKRGLWQLKQELNGKIAEHGHAVNRWESDGAGGWIQTCGRRVYPYPGDVRHWVNCSFTVQISPEREVNTGEVDADGQKVIYSNIWRTCTGRH